MVKHRAKTPVLVLTGDSREGVQVKQRATVQEGRVWGGWYDLRGSGQYWRQSRASRQSRKDAAKPTAATFP